MRLVTFQISTALGLFARVGALHEQYVVDLNMAYLRWLSDQGEAQPRRIADAQVPSTMLEFLEGGPSTMAAARRALDYVTNIGPSIQGPQKETICHLHDAVSLAVSLSQGQPGQRYTYAQLTRPSGFSGVDAAEDRMKLALAAYHAGPEHVAGCEPAWTESAPRGIRPRVTRVSVGVTPRH